jgi:hypothetical protein
MNTRRLIQLAALLMIGDGVLGFFKPRWHSLLWDTGPAPIRNLMESLAAHPDNARLLYAVEAAFGAWLASRQTPEKSPLL